MTGSDEAGASGTSGENLNTIGPGQSRAARGLLGWSVADLARASGLDEGFLTGFEAGSGDPASGQIEALRSALMREGVVFTDGDGVRLSERQRGGDEGTRLGDLTTENDR
ncbi:XRE family transcriptional regulator [Methylobacterium sp. Leaf456]|nr:XRE family transcriptional regulator [Methylobacterium sp. Leaf456]